MGLFMVLEDWAGDLGGPPSRSPLTIVGAGTLLDDTLYNVPLLLSTGCPLIAFVPAQMLAAKTAFDKQAGGVAQINPDGNLLALLYSLGAISGQVGPPNVAYVTVNGTATGMVGDASRPFATIKQALDALALSPYVAEQTQVRIGPGNFPGDIGLIPPALKHVSIIGSGNETTKIVTLTPGIMFDLGVNVARDHFAVQYLSAFSPSGLFLRYDGGTSFAGGDAFGKGALVLTCTVYLGGVDLKRMGTLAMNLAQLYGSVTVETISQWIIFQGVLGLGATFTQDWDDPLRGAQNLGDATWLDTIVVGGNLVLNKQAKVEARNCTCDGTIKGVLTVAAGLQTGGCSWVDGIVRAVDFSGATALPDTLAGQFKLDFTDSLIRDPSIVAVAGAGVNPQEIDLTGAEIAGPPFVIGLNMHARAGGVINDGAGPLFSTPALTGDVSIDTLVLARTLVVANPQPIPFPFRLKVGPGYAVTLDADDATMLPLATTLRNADGIEVTLTVISGNLRAVISQQS